MILLDENKIRYPIGKFIALNNSTSEQYINKYIDIINELPLKLKKTVEGLTLEQLKTPYRHDGWTIQQIVHHLADAEMNAFIRFKRGLTEDNPVAGTFHEDLWAQLSDYSDVPVETSITLIEALHCRFTTLLRHLEPSDFKRTVISPTHGLMSLDHAIQRFAWHASHHIAQISSCRERNGW